MSEFNSYTHGLDLTIWHELCREKGILMRFKKGEALVRRGNRLRYCGIVLAGTFKYVIPDNDGDRHVVGFVFANDLVGEFMAITRRRPAKTDIIAATDTEIIACDVVEFCKMLEGMPDFHIAMAGNLFCQAYDTCLDMYLKSPKDRYMALLKRCPDILQNISLKEMSSYLRITPTHLSRIRKELTFKGKP